MLSRLFGLVPEYGVALAQGSRLFASLFQIVGGITYIKCLTMWSLKLFRILQSVLPVCNACFSLGVLLSIAR